MVYESTGVSLHAVLNSTYKRTEDIKKIGLAFFTAILIHKFNINCSLIRARNSETSL